MLSSQMSSEETHTERAVTPPTPPATATELSLGQERGKIFITFGTQTPNMPSPTKEESKPDAVRQEHDMTSPFNTEAPDIHKALARYKDHSAYASPEVLSLFLELYDDDAKYTGSNDVFSWKFIIFLCNCEVAGVPRSDLLRVFPLMLAGEARDFYLAHCCSFKTMSLESVCDAFKSYFEGTEYKIRAMHDWEQTSLQATIEANKDKSLSDCLELMISKLRRLLHALYPEIQSEPFIRIKLLIACNEVPACHSACIGAKPTIGGLWSDLRSALAIHDRLNPPTSSPETTHHTFIEVEHHPLEPYMTVHDHPKSPSPSPGSMSTDRGQYDKEGGSKTPPDPVPSNWSGVSSIWGSGKRRTERKKGASGKE